MASQQDGIREVYEESFWVDKIKKGKKNSVFIKFEFANFLFISIQVEYLIKWYRYPNEDTWEPLEHLEDCSRLVASFEVALKKKQAMIKIRKTTIGSLMKPKMLKRKKKKTKWLPPSSSYIVKKPAFPNFIDPVKKIDVDAVSSANQVKEVREREFTVDEGTKKIFERFFNNVCPLTLLQA